MPKISKEIKIALLGICAILLFVFGYNYLKGTGVFSSSRIIFAEYDNVQGLTPACYVQLQGFTIGTVKDIELSETHPGKVLVSMSVDKKINIPADSKAAIISVDLLGTKAVDLVQGTSKQLVDDNGIIAGEITLGTIESLGASASPAIDNAKNVLASLDTTMHGINEILDAEGKSNLKHTLADLNKTMSDFKQFASTLNAQSEKIASLVSNLNSFTGTLDKNGATITKVLNNAEATTANLRKVDFEGTIRELKTTMDDLQTTLNKVNQGSGSMAMLMNDDKLYRNLKNTLATANNLLADINARPSRYINVAIFGRKNKNDCPPQQAPNAND